MIFIIDDDEIMAECIARAAEQPAKIFSNAVEAVAALNDELPSLIFLDILLDGPDGFTFLNEIVSYQDTAKIPIVIITSLDVSNIDLAQYGVIGILKKEQMKPEDIKNYAEQASR